MSDKKMTKARLEGELRIAADQRDQALKAKEIAERNLSAGQTELRELKDLVASLKQKVAELEDKASLNDNRVRAVEAIENVIAAGVAKGYARLMGRGPRVGAW